MHQNQNNIKENQKQPSKVGNFNKTKQPNSSNIHISKLNLTTKKRNNSI